MLPKNLLIVDSHSFGLDLQSAHCLVNPQDCYAELTGERQMVYKILKKGGMKLGEVHRWLLEQQEWQQGEDLGN